MNSASYRPGLSSADCDRERARRALQSELWIVCQRCAWPKAMGAVGTPDDVPYALFGTRNSEPEDADVIIVGFSSRGPQSSATHLRHGSAFRDSINRWAGKSSNAVEPPSRPKSQAIGRQAVAARAHSVAASRCRAKNCWSNTELLLESPGEMALVREPGRGSNFRKRVVRLAQTLGGPLEA